jgi:biogenesis of lysosome-related organelles complex 1 subunit 2
MTCLSAIEERQRAIQQQLNALLDVMKDFTSKSSSTSTTDLSLLVTPTTSSTFPGRVHASSATLISINKSKYASSALSKRTTKTRKIIWMEQSSVPPSTSASTSGSAEIPPSAVMNRMHSQIENELVKDTEAMFANIADYVQGELSVTSNDYKLLEQMNVLTTEKYRAMTDQAADLTLFMQELQKKYASFEPYLQQIDAIEKSVDELDRTVSLMDEYTKQLETKFRTLNEREKNALAGAPAVLGPSPSSSSATSAPSLHQAPSGRQRPPG